MNICTALFMKRFLPLRTLAVTLCLGQAPAVLAGLVVFQGSDFGVAPGAPHPNSDAAAAAFKLATGSFSIIDFESAPVGDFDNLALGSGVTASLIGTAPTGGISTLSSTTLGFNTTPGGTKFLHLSPPPNNPLAAAVFSFAAPIDSFGSYLTGLGTASGNLHVAFNDGSSQDLTVAGNAAGGVQFFGFTDLGKSISAVSLEILNTTASFDRIGIDDVITHPATVVPEPATVCFGLALIGACLGTRARRRE